MTEAEELRSLYFTRKQWSALPLKLRERWWRETDYGKKLPSAELHAACREARE